MTNFCIDCKYHTGPSPTMEKTSALSPMDFSRCSHPKAVDRSVYLVTGSTADIRFTYATIMRSASGPCGPDGELFATEPPHELASSDYPARNSEED